MRDIVPIKNKNRMFCQRVDHPDQPLWGGHKGRRLTETRRIKVRNPEQLLAREINSPRWHLGTRPGKPEKMVTQGSQVGWGECEPISLTLCSASVWNTSVMYRTGRGRGSRPLGATKSNIGLGSCYPGPLETRGGSKPRDAWEPDQG